MNDSKQRKLGAALSYLSIIITTLIQLLFTPFLIKKLGQSEYGLYSLVNSIIGYLMILDLGFGNAIIVYTAKYKANNDIESENKLHGMFKVIFIIIGIIAMLLGLVLYLNVDNIFSNTMTKVELSKTKIMMLILTFNLGISFVFSIYTSIINAYEKFVYQKILSLVGIVLKPALMIPLLVFGYKSISLTIVITVINLFTMIMNYCFCKCKLKINIKFKGFDKNLFKIIFGYSIWLFIGTIVDKINWSVDNFVLGAVVGTTAVSIYSVAAQLNTLFINLSTAISGVLLPKMSAMVAKNVSSEELTNEFIKVGRIQYYVIFLMCSGLILFGKKFIDLWVGVDYKTSYYIALILIIPVCFPLIQNLGVSILQAKGMYKFRSIVLFIIAISNIAISIPLAKLYGGIGSAIGTSISLLIGNVIIMNIYYYKKVGINVIKFWKEIMKMTAYFIFPVIFIILIMHFIILKGYIYLIVFGISYSLIYALICYMFVMNNYEKDIINRILRKIRIVG